MSVLIPPSSAQLRGELNTTALTLPDDLTYDEWVEYGHQLDHVTRAAQCWLGDWWRFGSHRYGERAKAVDGIDWDFQTCANAGWVAGRIESSRRREVLPWSHHAEVAALDVADQEHFLDRWTGQAIEDGNPPPRHVVRAKFAA
jgi:hypothetical protein